MIPIKQTLFDIKKGNCFQACIASIFELSLESVPNFIAMKNWEEKLDKWLEQFDCYYLELTLEKSQANTLKGYHLIGGKHSSGIPHITVGLNGKMIHDPHPDNEGLCSPLDDCEGKYCYGIFVNRNQCPELLRDIFKK